MVKPIDKLDLIRYIYYIETHNNGGYYAELESQHYHAHRKER